MSALAHAVSVSVAQSRVLEGRARERARARALEHTQEQLRARARALANNRRKKTRTVKALAGLANLFEFIGMPGTQELFTLRPSISLHVMEDAFADGHLVVSSEGVRIEYLVYGIEHGHNDSIVGRGAVDEHDSVHLLFSPTMSLRQLVRQLSDIWAAPLDLVTQEETLPDGTPNDYELERQVQVKGASMLDVFFQMLVDCADAKRFEKLMLANL